MHIIDGKIISSDMTKTAMGGTELMVNELIKRINQSY